MVSYGWICSSTDKQRPTHTKGTQKSRKRRNALAQRPKREVPKLNGNGQIRTLQPKLANAQANPSHIHHEPEYSSQTHPPRHGSQPPPGPVSCPWNDQLGCCVSEHGAWVGVARSLHLTVGAWRRCRLSRASSTLYLQPL